MLGEQDEIEFSKIAGRASTLAGHWTPSPTYQAIANPGAVKITKVHVPKQRH